MNAAVLSRNERKRSGLLRLGRRGVMYTVVAIMILAVVGAIFFTQARRTGHESAAAGAERVRTVNDFIHSFERDSQRAAYISGFRGFIAMEQYVTSTGSFITDPENTFRGVFLNGTIRGMNFTIMENSSFNDYVGRAQYNAAQQGILLNATVSNVSLWQVDPWNVMVNYTLVMDVDDTRGTAQWHITKTLTGKVPITDLRDPLFTARTYGRIQRVIKPTNVTLFVNDAADANDTTGLMAHFNTSAYVAAGRGPTMLMRFSGNISDSEFGIESLIDTEDLAAQGLPVNTSASVVDYEYFRNMPAYACSIQNVPSRVRLDIDHLGTYQVQGRLNYAVCP
jgi:hypothetical protein